jgi:hypothetical protein
MAMTVVTWGVTPTDVQNVTGASATAANIAMADSMISTYANRTAAASGGMGARDIFWIQSAICWQARWIPTQPALEGRNQFDSLSQDGMSVQSAAQWAKILAPMAARALKNLSNKGSKTDVVDPVEVPTGTAGAAAALFLTDDGDFFSDGWEPLHIT